MKTAFVAPLTLWLLTGLASAQQDPDDPGIQDSIIIGTVYVEPGSDEALVPIYAVTDENVVSYNLPLTWVSPSEGIYPADVTYHYPLSQWEFLLHEIFYEERFVRMIGVCGLHDCMYTDSLRARLWSVVFTIEEDAVPQIVTIDTTSDPIGGPLLFGLSDGRTEITPAFVAGYIEYGSVAVNGDDQGPPTHYTLCQNYPNPFNEATTIEFYLPSGEDVRLDIYNLLGQKVRGLVDGFLGAGNYAVRWDGTDERGAVVPSGLYFYGLTGSDLALTRRMVLLR